ncbi:vacuolar-processing enzyme-like [Rosa sericea]
MFFCYVVELVTVTLITRPRYVLLFLALLSLTSISPSSSSKVEDISNGTRWAVLIAGSRGYDNYRHQADVCHAYQILKKGGLKDENIVVFMYDDIAFNPKNPRPGVIINKPDGHDVYQGVPKDYTGKDINTHNFYAALLGNISALTGGSSKVLNSGPNDHVFIYYADHGSPGMVGMPIEGDYVYAKDLIDVLKKKHDAKGYKSMVFYMEACESGSLFEGLLPNNISIYATTAANSKESSWGFYCPGDFPSPPPGYDVCLGDLYSISWLEDCDKHDLSKETLAKQYEVVRRRTANGYLDSSHVMQFGNKRQSEDFIFTYMGTNPENDNYTYFKYTASPSTSRPRVVSQRNTDLLHLQYKFDNAPDGSDVKLEAHKQLIDEISRRKKVDYNVKQIGKLLFGYDKSSEVMKNVRTPGEPLVDDWDCFKMLVKTYEKHCGFLSSYGRKHTRAIANMCNTGVTPEQMAAACVQTCHMKSLSLNSLAIP